MEGMTQESEKYLHLDNTIEKITHKAIRQSPRKTTFYNTCKKQGIAFGVVKNE